MSVADTEVLGTRFSRGAIGGLAVGISVYILSFLAVLLLTRVLTPAEFSAYGVAAGLASVAQFLLLWPFSIVIVQRGLGDHPRLIWAALWSVACVSWPLALLLAAIASLAHENTPLLLGMSALLLLIPLRLPAMCRLLHEMRSVSYALLEASGPLAFAVCSSAAALSGLGQASFAVGLFAWGVVSAVIAVILGPRPSRPSFGDLKALRDPIRAHISLGFWLSARTQMLIPVLALFLVPTALGLTSWAYSLIAVPVSIVSFASQSVFAALVRLGGDAALQEEAFRRIVRVFTAGTALYLAVVCGAAQPLISDVFSPEFSAAVTILWLFAPGGLALVVLLLLVDYFTALGRGAALVMWQRAFAVCVLAILAPLSAFMGAEVFVALFSLGSIGAIAAIVIVESRQMGSIGTDVALIGTAAVIGALAGQVVVASAPASIALPAAVISSAIVFGACVIARGERGAAGDLRIAVRLLVGDHGRS